MNSRTHFPDEPYFSGYDLTYTVDAVGRWTKIEDASSNDFVAWSYYGPARRIDQASYLNGTTENRTYDGFRFVTAVDNRDSQPTVFAGFDYAYDKMGNPLYEERTHDSGKGDAYAYDKAYRLTAALIGSNDPSAEIADGDWLDYAYQKTIDYSMDDVSNRTSIVETPYGQQGASTGYTSNSVNWYTAVGGVSRTHDANGNLRFDGTYDYYYDYRNNLVRVEEDSAVVAEYEFDALNRRTKKTVGSDVTKFFYDREHVVEEYDGSGNLLRKFVYGQRIDEVRVMIAPDVADVDDDQNTTEVLHFYYHTNMLGSVTHVTGPNETVVEQYEYSPFGKTTIKDGQGNDLNGQSAIGNPYMYTARRFEQETGLYHYRTRTYDPSGGRFLQRDPLGRRVEANAYRYVVDSPTSLVDPMGLDPLKSIREHGATIQYHALECSDYDNFMKNEASTYYGVFGMHNRGGPAYGRTSFEILYSYTAVLTPITPPEVMADEESTYQYTATAKVDFTLGNIVVHLGWPKLRTSEEFPNPGDADFDPHNSSFATRFLSTSLSGDKRWGPWAVGDFSSIAYHERNHVVGFKQVWDDMTGGDDGEGALQETISATGDVKNTDSAAAEDARSKLEDKVKARANEIHAEVLAAERKRTSED